MRPRGLRSSRLEPWAAASILSAAALLSNPGRAEPAAIGPTPAPSECTDPGAVAKAKPAPKRDEAARSPQADAAMECTELPRMSVARRVLSTGAALVPGVLVHGSGHWVAGRPRAGRRLFAVEGAGLGGVAVGGTTIVLTGASRYLVGPSAALVVVGVGLFGISLLADVYGVAMPEAARGWPQTTAPAVETSLGAAYVYDPEFRYRSFVRDSIGLRTGSWRIDASGWFALDDPNARVRLVVARRLYGPLPRGQWPVARDGSYLDIDVAVTHHQYRTEHFQTLAGEAEVHGRLDLGRIDPSLRGSFGEMGLGWAAAVFDYDVPGLGFGSDWEDFLLANFGFGMYLDRRGSELELFYDHRHDDFAAGLEINGLVSGVAGHFGASSRVYFDDRWGAELEAQIGSAALVSLSALFRSEALP